MKSRLRQTRRRHQRFLPRRPLRRLDRSCLRGHRRGPGDFAQMLTAYCRAVRAHRKLTRLAPEFFDAAVVQRERENRAEQHRWMSFWEPHLAKAYGVAPEPVALDNSLPPLPPLRTQRAVDRQLAELPLWLAAAHAAGERHRQRQPHALPTLTQLARLLQLAFELKKLVLGLDSKNPLPEKITFDYEFTDLKRGYGHELDSAPPAVATSEAIASGVANVPANHLAPTSPPSSSAPLAEHDRSGVPVLPLTALPLPDYHRCDAWSRLARHLRLRSR